MAEFRDFVARRGTHYPFKELKFTRQRYLFQHYVTLRGHMELQHYERNIGAVPAHDFRMYPCYVLGVMNKATVDSAWKLVLKEKALPVPPQLQCLAKWFISVADSVDFPTSQKMLFALAEHLRVHDQVDGAVRAVTNEIVWIYLSFRLRRHFLTEWISDFEDTWNHYANEDENSTITASELADRGLAFAFDWALTH